MSSIQDIKIPEGWQQVNLDNNINILNWYAFKSDCFNEDWNWLPLIRIRDLQDSSISTYYDWKYPNQYIIKKWDLLVWMDWNFYTIKWDNVDALLNQRVCKVVSKWNIIFQDYLFFHLKEEIKKIEEMTTGTTVLHLSSNDIKKIYILVPKDLKEQEKIAEILTTIDEDIEKTDKLIEKYKKIKAGLMEDLFTKGIDVTTGKPHTKFKDSELGEIPESWKIKLVFMVTDYVDYRWKTPEKVEEGRFLVTARNIKWWIIDYNLSQEFIKESDYDIVMSRGLPKIWDVLFTTEAPMWEVANVDNEKIALAQRIIKFRWKNNKLNNYFLKYSFVSHYFVKLLKNESAGSTVEWIKWSRLHNLSLKIPEMKEQEKIVEILVEADNKINKEEEYKEKLVKMKKWLMNDLLTGKVRVKF